MKTYTTFAGAKRAAAGKPIVRLLDDPHQMWIVIDRLDTRVMIYTSEHGNRGDYGFAGSMYALDIASNTA